MANYNKSFNFRNGVQVDNDNFVVNANGLVGIGTTIPTDFLDVYGTSKFNSQISGTDIILSGLTSTARLRVGIVSITSGIITAISGIITYYGDGGNLLNLPTSQWIDVDSGLGYTSIYSAGNVGIATTNPNYTFQVGNNPNINFGVGINSTGSIKASGIITSYSFSGFGTDLQGINASNISNGTLNNSRLPQNINVSGIITASTNFIGNLAGNVNSTGLSTFSGGISGNLAGNVNSTGLSTFSGGISGNLTGNVNSTGLSTFSGGIVGNLTGNVNSTGLSTFSGGIVGNLTGNVNSTGLSTFSGGIVGNVIGIASTARSLTGTPNIQVANINASGIATFSSNLFANGDIGFGTVTPNANIHLRKFGEASLKITSDTNESFITLGSSISRINNNAEIRFGNINAYPLHSTQKSLDIINYDLGNVNSYVHLGSSGVGTGNFNWIYGQDASNILMSLTYTGELGIGITAPKNTLHIVGTSTVTNNSYIGNNLYVKNDVIIDGNLQIPSGNITASSVTANLTGNINSTSGNSILNNLGVSSITSAYISAGYISAISSNITNITTSTISTNVAFSTSIGIGTTSLRSVVDFADAGKNVSGGAGAQMIVPRLTTDQRNLLSLQSGGIIFNVTTSKFQGYTGIGWTDFH